ncbi:MAG: hypothetical protein IT206_00960 [Fimbriimonadaceae bacterium]|nr:hypothetical protein [Fimbriimonadaceae bacterium]
MRVRNKELRNKWHRKEQKIKELIKEAKAGGKKEKPVKAEKPVAAKKPAAPKKPAVKKAPAKKATEASK